MVLSLINESKPPYEETCSALLPFLRFFYSLCIGKMVKLLMISCALERESFKCVARTQVFLLS